MHLLRTCHAYYPDLDAKRARRLGLDVCLTSIAIASKVSISRCYLDFPSVDTPARTCLNFADL